jgi:predicted ATPase
VAVARHDVLVEAAVVEHGGVQIRRRGEGDRRFAAFRSAHDATRAAVAVQRAFVAERWPTPDPIRVRIAVHTGEAELRDGDYYGSAVDRCAQLRGIGHGSQILLSETTAGLIREDPPTGTSLRFLGEHRLKDLTRPERVSQVLHPALPDDFPPLDSLDARLHNLPVQPTALLGREHELEAVRSLLLRDDVQLVTLTGPGGIGKTRLALQVAADVMDLVPDGVFFVSLAPINDPELVISTIAQVLGLREAGGRSLQETVTGYLQERHLLLVLDNFEQILPAAAQLAALLAECGRLTMLVTSRAVLHLQGEHEFAVPPLALPDPERATSAESLGRYAAVSLFVQRAVDVGAGFSLTDENVPTVAEICWRLDGLPLAIELAGARTRLLSPKGLLHRLERRLPVLTGGWRDLPARQRTLRDTIAWSHDLLDDAERQLFRRLSVFVGGFTLEAAEMVCPSDGEPGIDVLDGVSSLVDKSLLRQDDGPNGEPRFSMLETIREFAVERLEASGETASLRRRHAGYYLTLAEEAEIELRGAQQAVWLDRLEADHDNLRAALTRGQPETAGSAGDPALAELGLRLAGALVWFWLVRGYVGEGYRSLEAALAASDRVTLSTLATSARAKALGGAGHLAQYLGDYARSIALLEESVALFREAGDESGIAWSVGMLGEVARNRGSFEQAAALLEESLALARQIGDRWTMYHVLYRLGEMARNRGEYDRAATLYEESLVIRRDFGDRRGIAAALHSLGIAAREQGRPRQAATLLVQSLALHSEVQNKIGIAICLAGLAGIALTSEQPTRAARLLGAVEALCEAIGAPLLPAERAHYDRDRAAARDRLGEADFTAAWVEGRAMALEQAVAYALEGADAA